MTATQATKHSGRRVSAVGNIGFNGFQQRCTGKAGVMRAARVCSQEREGESERYIEEMRRRENESDA